MIWCSHSPSENYRCDACGKPMIVAGGHDQKPPQSGGNTWVRYTCHGCGFVTLRRLEGESDADYGRRCGKVPDGWA